MEKIINMLINEESGQGMVEYGLLIILVVITVVTAVKGLGNTVLNFYKDTNNSIP